MPTAKRRVALSEVRVLAREFCVGAVIGFKDPSGVVKLAKNYDPFSFCTDASMDHDLQTCKCSECENVRKWIKLPPREPTPADIAWAWDVVKNWDWMR